MILLLPILAVVTFVWFLFVFLCDDNRVVIPPIIRFVDNLSSGLRKANEAFKKLSVAIAQAASSAKQFNIALQKAFSKGIK